MVKIAFFWTRISLHFNKLGKALRATIQDKVDPVEAVEKDFSSRSFLFLFSFRTAIHRRQSMLLMPRQINESKFIRREKIDRQMLTT